MEKVYVFGNEATAETFRMLAYALNLADNLRRVGSAIVASPEVYKAVMDKTNAISATVVGSIESIL